MSSYRDPAPRGDVFPSEEEIDPTGTTVEAASGPDQERVRAAPAPSPDEYSVIVTHHRDGSIEVTACR